MVVFDRLSAWDRPLFVFRVIGSDEEIYVDNFCNGIATIWCKDATCINAETIAGCFDDESNFASELCKIFINEEASSTTDKLEAIHLKISSNSMTLEIKKNNT